MARKSLGALILEGLEEILAYERGELELPTKTVTRTASDAKVEKPPRYDADRVRNTRLSLGYSQQVFAQALNVSSTTVKAWEQGNRTPEGPTLRLLEIAEEAPAVLARKVHWLDEHEDIAAD
jgi:putative transcriptional regulator